MRYQGHSEMYGGGGHPTIGIVHLVGEGMTEERALGPESGVPLDEFGARPDDLCTCNLRVETIEPGPAPPRSIRAISDLGYGLEAYVDVSADQHRRVRFDKRGVAHDVCREDAGVDYDTAA
jgi:hypothetical protein